MVRSQCLLTALPRLFPPLCPDQEPMTTEDHFRTLLLTPCWCSAAVHFVILTHLVGTTLNPHLFKESGSDTQNEGVSWTQLKVNVN